jgi:hypothetical protein
LLRAGVRNSIKVVELIDSDTFPYLSEVDISLLKLRSTPDTSVDSSLKYVVVTPIKSPLEFLVILEPFGFVLRITWAL